MEQKRKILPLGYWLSALVLMIVIHKWAPLGRYIQSPYHLVGVAVSAFGLAMTLVSAGAFRKAETGLLPFEPATTLITRGFYRYTRNPMYLGLVLALLGTSAILQTTGTLIPIVLFIWVIHGNFILGEERFMEAAFGEDYIAYKQNVRRWI